MDRNYAVLVKGFTTQEQADEFVKWFCFNSPNSEFTDCFEFNQNVSVDVADDNLPVKQSTILDESHNEIEVSHLNLTVTDVDNEL